MSPVSDSFDVNLRHQNKNVRSSEDAWLQGPLWEGSTGETGPGLVASALHRVCLLAGGTMCWCAHALEPGIGHTHYTYVIFSLD